MIQENIVRSFPQHLTNCTSTDQHIFVADYTNQTKNTTLKRGTEFFVGNPPTDIKYFSLDNPNNIKAVGIPFDKDSFSRIDGKIDTQCECVIFPANSNPSSWICFIELKYSNNVRYNPVKLDKAKNQLIGTQNHYRTRNIFSKTNTCYLFASFPMQFEPFPNTYLDPSYLLDMKEKYNIVIRFKNSAEIINDKQINA